MTPANEPASVDARRLAWALLIMRISLGVFVFLWGLEKLIIPERTVGIFGKYYGIELELAVAPFLGVAQCILAAVFLAGAWRRWSYGLVTVLHTYSVITSWRSLIDPWGLINGEVKHLFLAGVPVLAAFIALYMLREYDLWSVEGRRAREP